MTDTPTDTPSAAPTVPAFAADVDRDTRRALVVASDTLNGIDFVEVLIGTGTTLLLVHLLSPPPYPMPSPHPDLDEPVLDAEHVVILGGVWPDPRINPVRVLWACLANDLSSAPATAYERKLVAAALGDPDPGSDPYRAQVLVVRASSSGDSSTYRLRLRGDDPDDVPSGFDPVLSEMPFSFRVDEPGGHDPRAPQAADAVTVEPSPLTDYLARDAEALRTRLLDRFAALVPGWHDSSPADPAVMLMEIFAALGDRLAYWQDAVAVEAFLGTARQRASVRRHARLLDYEAGEGCSARAWLAWATDSTVTVQVATAVADVPVPAGTTAADAAALGAVVFETCQPVDLFPARNAVELYAWQDADHVLPKGTRAAFLAVPPDADLHLAAGDVLLLADCPAPEGLGPDTPRSRFERCRQGDPTRRFAVRLDRDPVVRHDPLHPGPVDRCWTPPDQIVLEIHWYAGDALPGSLTVRATGPGGAPVPRAVALANVVPADHGVSVPAEPLVPAAPTEGVPFRPRLQRSAPAWVDRRWADPDSWGTAPATTLCEPDPRPATPALTLYDGRRTWTAVRDLLGSGRLDAHVVVEPDGRGGARLRFGDGVNGRSPGTQTPFAAEYRVGGGLAGNVAADRLGYLLATANDLPGAGVAVWNPLPSRGGTEPEDVEVVRRLAPADLHRQERAVTAADYATQAQRVPGVQRATVRRRWNGSWYVQEAALDPLGVESLTSELRDAVLERLELVRMAGTDVEVTAAAYASLLIALTVQVADGFTRLEVEGRLRDALSARTLSGPIGGRRGFFHPDAFSFGQPVYLRDLDRAVMQVDGVAAVEVTRFGRLTDSPDAAEDSLAEGRIDVGAGEVARCDGDPARPENGRVELTLRGGW